MKFSKEVAMKLIKALNIPDEVKKEAIKQINTMKLDKLNIDELKELKEKLEHDNTTNTI